MTPTPPWPSFASRTRYPSGPSASIETPSGRSGGTHPPSMRGNWPPIASPSEHVWVSTSRRCDLSSNGLGQILQTRSAEAGVSVSAHNLIRWTSIRGNIRVDDQLVVARTTRTVTSLRHSDFRRAMWTR